MIPDVLTSLPQKPQNLLKSQNRHSVRQLPFWHMKGLVRLKSKLALSGEFMFDCHGSWYKFTTIELWIEHPSAEIPRFELRLRAFLGLKGKARPLEHDGPASAQRVLIILPYRLGGTR